MDMGSGEEEEGEMYGESNTETYITICKIDSQWEFAVCLRKLKQGLCINLEGWDGERGARECPFANVNKISILLNVFHFTFCR